MNYPEFSKGVEAGLVSRIASGKRHAFDVIHDVPHPCFDEAAGELRFRLLIPGRKSDAVQRRGISSLDEYHRDACPKQGFEPTISDTA